MARTLRLDEETERLVAIAAAEDRVTRHALIVQAVREWLLRRGSANKTGALARALDRLSKSKD